MRIGIDARFLTDQRRGIGRYSFNLITRLLGMNGDNQYVLYFDKNFDRSVLPRRGNYECRCIGNGNSIFWEQYYLPKQLRRDQLDLFHSVGNIPPVFSRVRRVLTLHDTIMFHPGLCSKGMRRYNFYFRTALRHSVNRIDRIITVSRNSQEDIIRLFPEARAKVEVIHEGIEKAFHPMKDQNKINCILQKYNIKRPFILHFGSCEPRKNTSRVLRVFHRLIDKKTIPHNLVLLGFGGKKSGLIDTYLNKNNLKARVIDAGFVPEEELPYFYNGADLLFYPSLYEGFGFPPLEALACGTPVVTSRISSLPEIIGKAAVYVDPKDELEMCAACLETLHNRQLREKLKADGLKRAKGFSWEETALKTSELYKEIGESKRGK